MSRPWINRISGSLLILLIAKHFLESAGIFTLPGDSQAINFGEQIILIICAVTLLRSGQRALQLITSGILLVGVLFVMSISLFQIFGEGFMSNTMSVGSLEGVQELTLKGPLLTATITTDRSGAFALAGGRKTNTIQTSGKLSIIESSQWHPLQKLFSDVRIDLGTGRFSKLTIATWIGSTQAILNTGFLDTLALQQSIGSIQLSLSEKTRKSINVDLGAGSVWLRGMSNQAYKLNYHNSCAGIGDTIQGLEAGPEKNTYFSPTAKAFSGTLPIITVNMVCGSLVIE